MNASASETSRTYGQTVGIVMGQLIHQEAERRGCSLEELAAVCGRQPWRMRRRLDGNPGVTIDDLDRITKHWDIDLGDWFAEAMSHVPPPPDLMPVTART